MKKLLFHMTHIENLTAILNAGELKSYRQLIKDSTEYKDIAAQNVQSRRAETKVPLYPGGLLHDYVPFYFAGRSPMLYVVKNNGIPQSDLIYLMTNTERIVDSTLPFVFTDGHAIMVLSSFYSSLDDLNRIDWNVMSSDYWNDTLEDPDRKRKRQAEFLIYKSISLEWITGIATYTNTTKAQVEDLIRKSGHSLPVYVVPRFYY